MVDKKVFSSDNHLLESWLNQQKLVRLRVSNIGLSSNPLPQLFAQSSQFFLKILHIYDATIIFVKNGLGPGLSLCLTFPEIQSCKEDFGIPCLLKAHNGGIYFINHIIHGILHIFI